AGGVETAGAMHSGSGVSRSGTEIEPANRCAVTEIGEGGAEEQLLPEMGTAAAQVAAGQVLIHGLQIRRTVSPSAENELAKTRCKSFDPPLNPVGKWIALQLPGWAHRRWHMRVGPERVAAGWGATGIGQG